jgi:hypothetical protein
VKAAGKPVEFIVALAYHHQEMAVEAVREVRREHAKSRS